MIKAASKKTGRFRTANGKFESIIQKLIAQEVLDAYKAIVQFFDMESGGIMLEFVVKERRAAIKVK